MAFDIGSFFKDLVNPNSNTARDTRNVISSIPLLGGVASWQLGNWGYGADQKVDDSTLTHPGIVSNIKQVDQTPAMVKRLVEPSNNPVQQTQDTGLPSYADALAQAQALMSASGYNPGYIDVNSISWDPLRKDANSRATDYDAKVAAMYKALTSDVRTTDKKAIQDNFSDAQDTVKGNTDRAVNEMTGASNSINAHDLEVMKNLGLDDAVARAMERGTDSASAVKQNIADAVARGQTSENALTQKQKASLDANTQMAGAYGLQGAETRDNLKLQLASLLANYDMSEQQARTAAQEKNASLAQQSQSTLYNLASQILGNDWNTVKYNDSLAQAQAEAAQSAATAAQDAQTKAAAQSTAQDMLNRLLGSDYHPSGIDDVTKYVSTLSGLKKFIG